MSCPRMNQGNPGEFWKGDCRWSHLKEPREEQHGPRGPWKAVSTLLALSAGGTPPGGELVHKDVGKRGQPCLSGTAAVLCARPRGRGGWRAGDHAAVFSLCDHGHRGSPLVCEMMPSGRVALSSGWKHLAPCAPSAGQGLRGSLRLSTFSSPRSGVLAISQRFPWGSWEGLQDVTWNLLPGLAVLRAGPCLGATVIYGFRDPYMENTGALV